KPQTPNPKTQSILLKKYKKRSSNFQEKELFIIIGLFLFHFLRNHGLQRIIGEQVILGGLHPAQWAVPIFFDRPLNIFQFKRVSAS
ncbi:MAG: hypothetical protein AAFO58_12655, partial [Pseudomonadota bacterium]